MPASCRSLRTPVSYAATLASTPDISRPGGRAEVEALSQRHEANADGLQLVQEDQQALDRPPQPVKRSRYQTPSSAWAPA